MANVYGDNRECAKQADELLHQKGRQTPPIEGEKDFMPRVHIFSHFDSRGGSFITEEKNVINAIKRYVTEILDSDVNDDDDVDMGMADYMGTFEVVSIGSDIPREGDILYDDNGLTAYRLETTLSYDAEPQWFPRKTLVLAPPNTVRNFEQEAGVLTHKFRLVSWDLEEDACGLVWF